MCCLRKLKTKEKFPRLCCSIDETEMSLIQSQRSVRSTAVRQKKYTPHCASGISHLPVQGSLSAYKRKSVCNKQSEFIHLDMWHMSYNPGIWDGRQENCQLEDRLENPDSKWTKTWIEYSHATFTNENTDRFHFACRYTTSTTEGKRHMESDSH